MQAWALTGHRVLEPLETWLIKEHGADGAYLAAVEGAATALKEGDGYRLSVWRDVKRTLTERARQVDSDVKDR